MSLVQVLRPRRPLSLWAHLQKIPILVSRFFVPRVPLAPMPVMELHGTGNSLALLHGGRSGCNM